MITITKDKNIMKIEVSGTTGYYAFDLNSGIFYGKKGSPLKVIPSKYDIARAFGRLDTNIGNLMDRLLNAHTAQSSEYTNFIKAYKGAEKIDALGIRNFSASRGIYELIEDNFSLFSKYIKEKADEINNGDFLSNFSDYMEFEKQKSELGTYAEVITSEMYRAIAKRNNEHFTEEEWGVIAYYLIRGKLWEYSRLVNSGVYALCEYIKMCRYMKKTPNKQNNFMREYVETKREYDLRKEEYDNAKIADYFALHKKAFDFTYGNYTVVIPKSAKDIIDEGTNMHHCVGGYAPRVVNGEQYIIFIRHKDTPDKCYITAQVYNDGRIGQYYLAYDHYIHTTEDNEFYNALKKHLAENW